MTQGSSLSHLTGLHPLYPLTKLVFACAIVLVGFLAPSPHVPILLFIFVILPVAAWGRIGRQVLRVAILVVLPFAISLVLVQGFFYPGAHEVILNVGPLALKKEGLLFAYATAGRILLLTGSGLLLLFSTRTADLVLALRQHGLPNSLAYVILAALQLLPQMFSKGSAILDAQRSRGLETEGNVILRVRALLPILGPLVLSSLTDVDERAMALEARAFSSPRIKTSYKELRDTRAQSFSRIAIALIALLIGAIEVAIR